MTPTSQFTPSESNGLVYKPHQPFLAQNLTKKVQLIPESLWYLSVFTVLLLCYSSSSFSTYMNIILVFLVTFKVGSNISLPGCIRNVTVNKRHIGLPTTSHKDKDCYLDSPESGVSFEDGGGYLKVVGMSSFSLY